MDLAVRTLTQKRIEISRWNLACLFRATKGRSSSEDSYVGQKMAKLGPVNRETNFPHREYISDLCRFIRCTPCLYRALCCVLVCECTASIHVTCNTCTCALLWVTAGCLRWNTIPLEKFVVSFKLLGAQSHSQWHCQWYLVAHFDLFLQIVDVNIGRISYSQEHKF